MALFSKNKEKKLTRRERAFFKILADNPTIPISDAGRQAGYSEATVRSGRLNNMANYGNSPLKAALEKEGFTAEYIAKGMMEGSKAFKTKIINRKTAKYQYEIVKEHMVDFLTRKGYFELAARMRGEIEPDQINGSKTEVKIANIVISPEMDINEAMIIYQQALKK